MTKAAKSNRPRRFARTSAPEAPAEELMDAGEQVEPAPVSSQPRKTDSKIARVVGLLQRQEGATLDEMITETGWLPHTTRAALTGLKKKGHTIERSKRSDVTCYRITTEA